MLLDNTRLQGDIAKLKENLEKGQIDKAVKLAERLSNRRLVDIIVSAPEEAVIPFLKGLSWQRAARVAAWLPEELTLDLMENLIPAEQQEFISRLDSDELTDLLDHLPEEERQKYISLFLPDQQEEVEQLAEYAPDSVGGHMEKEYLTIHQEQTARDALEKMRQARQQQIDNIGYIYVIDESGGLKGVASSQMLAFADRNSAMKDFMITRLQVARVDEEAVEAARVLRYRRYKMLPVLDKEDRLVGVLTLDTAIDLLAEEMTGDFVSFAGTSEEESFFTNPRKAIKMRLPWMVANVFLNLGAVAVISSFEATIAQIAILAAFLPMITDMGGNVGIQALSVSIRSMALGEVQPGEVARELKKEALIGLFNGAVLGGLFALLAFLLERNPLIGLVAGMALGINVLVAGIVGGTLPFIIKKLGRDPAMMTGPFLTTITDITGVSIYLGLSTLLLLQILG